MSIAAVPAPAPARLRRGWNWSLLAAIASAIALTILIVLPVGTILLSSIYEEGLTLSAYGDFATNGRMLTATLNSLAVAGGIAILSVAVGMPLAFGVARTHMRFKGLVRVTMILALISPEFLLAMGYILMAGPNAGYANLLTRSLLDLQVNTGPFDIFSLWGLVFTALPNGVAFVFLALTPALANMDPALEEAARLKGASPLRAVTDVTLPLMRPALLAGALLAFATSLAMYGAPEMLGIDVLTVSIREAMLGLDFSAASVAAVTLVALSAVALGVQRLLLRHGERYRTLGGKAFAARTLDLGIVTHMLTALGVAYVLMALVLPYGTMIAVSMMKSIGNGFVPGNWTLENFVVVLSDTSIRNAVVLSFTLAAASASLVVVIGVLTSYIILRTRYRARFLLDYVSILPLAVPGTAIGFALIVVYLNWPGNLTGIYGTPAILLVAYLARFIPIGVRNGQTALLQIAPELEEAARVFGSSEAGALLRITIPLMLPVIIYTWLLVFILAIPELSASIVLRGFGTQTISTSLLGVWNGNGGLAVACAYGVCIFAVVSALFMLAAFAGRRSAAVSNSLFGK
ncbi:ABC transporter permease [Roseicitreum antarcticum]|uniref:Iron(III) transport system permease protein n=1 Tax=Roseicitreum antarcticum TaxID=564137 RepID=A0A1H2YJL0_9RHOB|nr:iron ABC transporter permease [Roseicitreum antarcticum]SDX05403.1 iron(III) transport system permease protein [Roseicitreum antarcticum]